MFYVIIFVWIFYIFSCIVYAKIYLKRIYHFSLSLFLSERFNNNLRGSDVLLFSEFINVVSILFYNFVEFIILLYTRLEISFARYKKKIIWWI